MLEIMKYFTELVKFILSCIGLAFLPIQVAKSIGIFVWLFSGGSQIFLWNLLIEVVLLTVYVIALFWFCRYFYFRYLVIKESGFSEGNHAYFRQLVDEIKQKQQLSRFRFLGNTLSVILIVMVASVFQYNQQILLYWQRYITSETAVKVQAGYFKDCDTCPSMVAIPRGEYLMGANDSSDRNAAFALPQTKIIIDYDLAVGQFEITYQEYIECVKDKYCTYDPRPYSYEDEGPYPINRVHFLEAVMYTEWLSDKTNSNYRLPTESEWEYFARAGTKSNYYWGERFDRKYAVCKKCVPDKESVDVNVMKVGSFLPNSFGLYDIAGNIAEYTTDCWGKGYKGIPRNGKPKTSSNGGNCGLRVVRGGEYRLGKERLYVWRREAVSMSYHLGIHEIKPDEFDSSKMNIHSRDSGYGFRIVKEI